MDAHKLMLNGLKPAVLSASVIRFSPGTCSDGEATPDDVMTFSTNTDVDFTVCGANGIDESTPVDGEWYYPYAIMDSTLGTTAIIASRSISVSNVSLPTGFDNIRKIPWGMRYNAVGGFWACHIEWGESPRTRYTFADTGATWRALNAATSSRNAQGTPLWDYVDLSPFMPDNARLAYLCCVVSGTGAGSARLRAGGGGGLGIPCGSILQSGEEREVYLDIPTSSARGIYFKTTGLANLSIYQLGFSQTELA